MNTLNQTQKNMPVKNTKQFDKLAHKMSEVVGSPYWFFFSIVLILVWLPTGFFLGFGEIWHLLINTTTTILTFLMMSLLHSSQKNWETRMENRQKREGTALNTLKQEAKQITKNITPEN